MSRKPYRSGSEKRCADDLCRRGIPYGYETRKLRYTVPATARTYTPDFTSVNGVHVEVKGRWTMEDRRKHLHVRACNPGADVRLLFDVPSRPIRKGSETIYAAWRDKHGITRARGPKVPQG